MKKLLYLSSLALLLLGCTSHPSTTSTSSQNTATSSSSTSSSSLETSSTSSSSSKSDSSSSSSEERFHTTIADLFRLGASLKEGETGADVTFKGRYLKKITEGNDKVMLFGEEGSSIFVRVSNSLWNDFLENRYLDVAYQVTGKLHRQKDYLEVTYQSLANIEEHIDIDYQALATACENLNEVYAHLETLTVSEKYHAVGNIVSFEAQLIATDRSDANKKAVFSDGHRVLTVIDTKKIADATNDLGKWYSLTGVLNIERSKPGLLLLKQELLSPEKQPISYENAVIVDASYFQKWNTLTDKMSPPTLQDYSRLYQMEGYVRERVMSSKSYMGVVDQENDTLNYSTNVTTIRGLFLMNHLNLSSTNLTFSKFYPALNQKDKVKFCFSLFAYETQWHGWKIMPIETSLQYPSM